MGRLLVLLLFATFNSCKSQGGMQQPKYVVTFESEIYTCPDEQSKAFIDTSGIESDRYNESVALLTGKVNFLQGLGEKTMLEVRLFKIINGREEACFTHEICDLCNEVGNKHGSYSKYLKFFGFPDKCPMEPGEIEIDNLLADTSDLPMNSANAGEYCAVMNIFADPNSTCDSKKASLLACIKFNFAIEMADD